MRLEVESFEAAVVHVLNLGQGVHDELGRDRRRHAGEQ